MTQLEPSPEPPASHSQPTVDSQQAIPTDIPPLIKDDASIPSIPMDRPSEGYDDTTGAAVSSLTAGARSTEYRPPEAVPIPESDTEGWGDSTKLGGWGEPKGNIPWMTPWEIKPEDGKNWESDTRSQDGWGTLGVLGTDDAWKDDSDKWWDKDLPSNKKKPGPGMIAPRVIEAIHDSDHILYEVVITGNPTTEPSNPLSPKSSITATGALNSPRTLAPAAFPTSPVTPVDPIGAMAPASSADAPDATTQPTSETPDEPHVPPTQEELRDAIPHPSALFCRRHYGWVIMSATVASATASHLGTHWCSAPDKRPLFDKLPDPALRKDKDCSEASPETVPYPTTNWSSKPEYRMHHFHMYKNVVAGSGLYPPLKRPLSAVSPRPVIPTTSDGDVEMESASQVQETQEAGNDVAPQASWEWAPVEEHLDLYVCCQCKTQVICSPAGGVIPCTIPSQVMESYIADRGSQPKPNQTKEQSVLSSLEMLLRVIEEPLWSGNNKSLLINGKVFSSRIGWSDNSRLIFEAMGFTLDDGRVTPPTLEVTTPTGRAARMRLLRLWVEMGVTIAEYMLRNPSLKPSRKNSIRVSSAWEGVAKRLGSHPDQMPRNDNISAVASVPWTIFEALGITRSTATAVETAYGYQLRCDPLHTPTYYHALQTLSRQPLPGVHALEDLLAKESSKDRWTEYDLQSAAETLGFGINGVIGTEYVAEEADDEYILLAFQTAFKEAGSDSLKRSRVKSSLKILGESRSSHKLVDHYNRVMSSSYMDIDEAYRILEVTKEVDDDTLVVVYQVRIADSPFSKERMQNALLCVAEERNSSRLRELVTTGVDPGKPQIEVPPDFPRGLQQLGNTCYLNSLLQYFYTVKELRDVIGTGNFDLEAPISEEDLSKHRIGGRLVTKREVERSKKFVKLLGGLFMQMMCVDEPAITPELELAKLALVTSKDEEEDGIGEVVAETPVKRSKTPEGSQRRFLDPLGIEESEMPDSPIEDQVTKPADGPSALEENADATMESRPASPPALPTETKPESEPTEKPEPATIVVPVTQVQDSPKEERMEADTSQNSMVVETGDEPPTEEVIVGPRRKSTVVVDSGTMMFGKQHDVSEVFDNCMFQIETALRFESSSSESTGSGTIKKLFYGKLLQRLSPISDPTTSPTISPTKREGTTREKEDLFSHLLVNVSDEGFDLYDGLSGYFEDEVEYGGKRAKMDVALLDLPPILQIQLQRVQFNRDTMQAFKSNAYVKFEETLLMDRFLANIDPEKKAESKKLELELADARQRLKSLTNPGNGANLTASLSGAKAFLSTFDNDHPDIDEELKTHLAEEITFVEEEISRTRTRAQELKTKLEEFWKGERQAEYQLASVFIHRGTSPSFGHYFFYSRRLPDKPDEWFKYNDSEVTAVGKDEVLADGTGSTANPYLLVYVRKDSNIVDTVHRIAAEQ
ncbi:ubiquitin carboxyl-terminal hydrolase [Ceratobasidium sp. AG-Ba]|nr:ubiquitin carboxyl-terminal hydrolase [Ceratobasidium sp. AG-Ba]